jgi:hypothetical protein
MSEGKPQLRVYGGYQGKENPSERERIMHLLDVYRSTEGLAASFLPRWMAVSTNEALKGGLLAIQQREASHACVLETRLRALGGMPQATVPAEVEEKETAFFASPARSDVEKLRVVDELFGDADAFLQPLTELIGQIKEDPQTQELLRTIVEDERATIQWFKGLYSRLSGDRAATESLS